jgi:diguanylate cyclase (GGDEF)-like protein/PAS domain S-box-containing protein
MNSNRRRSRLAPSVEPHAQARYRATFQQSAVGIAHTARDGTLIDVNEAFCALLGYDRAALVGMPLSALEADDASGRVGRDEHVRQLFSGDSIDHASVERYRRCDGTLVWLEQTVSLAPAHDGDAFLIRFVQDVTQRRDREELQRQRELGLQRILEAALECIITTDHEGCIVEFNPMAERVFRYARAEVLGRRLVDVLVPPRLRRRHEASMRRLLTSEQQSMLDRRIETIALRGDGTTVPVELTMQRISDTDPPLFTGFLRDITERKEAEARILRLNRLYRTLSHTSALIMRAVDSRALFRGVCRIAREHGGFIGPTVQLVGARGARDEFFTHDRESAEPHLSLEELEASEIVVRERRAVIRNDVDGGGAAPESDETSAGAGIRSYAALPLILRGEAIGVFHLHSALAGYFDADIQRLLQEMMAELSYALERLKLETEHRHAVTALRDSTHFDQLTALPNRRVFYERLTHALAQAERHQWTIGVMILDLDRFKSVNDTLGHTVGDTLLRQIAHRLGDCIRGEDTVSRLSGDEFAIVLAKLADADDAGLVAAKVLQCLQPPFIIDEDEVVVSASIGITLYPDDAATAEDLMRNADIAMYNAKAHGRANYQFYTAEMNARALAKTQLESRLRGALDRDEFVLHFQPKVMLESGLICGFEALIRWQPPNEALVPPSVFIPVLEETGLITPVGEWVVKAACRQIVAWRGEGLTPVPVAINLSARQLRHAGFSRVVATTLAECRIEPKLLEVEITESSLMENPEEAQIALAELKEIGVTLAIDDFGTGYSSLAYLKRFPFDTLKIDRSFVRDIPGDSDDATIARTIIALAHSLSLEVVAEGVETEEQLAFLLLNRCDLAQGYLFAKPLPGAASTALLAARKPLYDPIARAVLGESPAVLVLDDAMNDLILVQRLLERDGCRVLIATNANDALDLMATHNVAAVVSDARMPGISGVEFFSRVKRSHPEVTRIMLSGSNDPSTVSAAINEGAVHKYFVKGRDDELLRDSVRKAIRRAQPPFRHGA